MSATDRTSTLSASTAPVPEQAPAPTAGAAARRSLSSALERVQPRHAALTAILALSVVLNTRKLAHNGYANIFYSAGVKSMLGSLHNFLFASFDPGGLVTIDKPPLAIWLQTASAKLFGLSPLSLLLPEAIVSTIAVAVLYRMLARRLGAPAGLTGALALAVFPSFVAVSRDNGVDPLLILLMLLACGAALNAIESGRWRSLVWCAALVGLAFETKTLAAYLVVPGIALAYATCAPGSALERATKLLVAGAVTVAVSLSWIAVVELTPRSDRPFVGSSTDNTEIGLTLAYNGFGRVEGEIGGPGRIPVAEGAVVRPRTHVAVSQRTATTHRPGAHARHRRPKPPLSPILPNGRYRNPIAFGGPTGPLRLFEASLADQGAWMLPFALMGLLALALLALGARGRSRRDPRLATLIVLGGWLLVELAVLSLSKGIVHPYYISALAPGAAAMVGAGTVAFADFARRRDWRALLLAPALILTIAVQMAILHDQRYMRWYVPILIGGVAVGLAAMAVRRLAGAAMALVVCLLLLAPGAYAATTWLAPVEGTFPAAGPHQASGEGELGLTAASMRVYRELVNYLAAHPSGARWSVLTDASTTAAPLILLGVRAAALGGYSGTDPVLDGPGLARLVKRGEARYVVLGGAYASRGGNLATKAVLRACRELPASAWHGPKPSIHALVLFDCTGRERALSA